MHLGKRNCAEQAEGGHGTERGYVIDGEGAGGNEQREIRFTASPRADAHGTQPDQPADRRIGIDDPERRLHKTMREVGLDESDSCRIVTSDRDRAPGAKAGQRVVRGGGYPKIENAIRAIRFSPMAPEGTRRKADSCDRETSRSGLRSPRW